MTQRANDDYVTNAAWSDTAARHDTIDEIADQFERPVAAGAASFWSPGEARWPQRPRSWDAGRTVSTLGIAS